MDEVASPFFHLMPITVPTGCQLLLANTDQLRRCQLDAFDRWVRSTVPRSYGPLAQGPEAVNWASSNLPQKNSCCYRWALLDCLAEGVQDYCTDAEAFDLRVFLGKRAQVVLYYETFQCSDYPFGSFSCHISYWTIAALVLGILLLISFVVFLVYTNVRSYSKRMHRPKKIPKVDPVTDL